MNPAQPPTLRQQIVQFIGEIQNELRNFKIPKEYTTKNHLLNISGRFSGIFNELRGFSEGMTSFSNEINEASSQR
uniref:Uncharacterized protein n=1 Tax=Meloidogyne enterolobii TaxID=390850 RepID=A0A6V7W586_MELEN|nr:unnamed protein product [Meloidogyne enterolobii]